MHAGLALTAAWIALAPAGTAAEPPIALQPLVREDMPEGVIHQAYYLQDPAGRSLDWHARSVVASESHQVPGGLQVRVDGRLHHLTVSAAEPQPGPFRYRGATYQRHTRWADRDLRLDLYENTTEEAHGNRWTKGLLVLQVQTSEVAFPLWGFTGGGE